MTEHNQRAVIGGNSAGMDEALSRFDLAGYMLARYETLALAVRDDRIDRACLKVLAALIATMNRDTRTSWAGREAVAAQTEMTVKSVSNYIHQLKGLGYLVSERRQTPQANNRVLMHYTLAALSPDEIETAIGNAVQSIQGKVNTVREFPSRQELSANSSCRDGNSLPETSRPSGNSLPVLTGTCIESSRPDGHSIRERARIKNNTNITTVLPRGEGGVGGEITADAPKVKRGTRLPEDWFLPKAWGEWATENFHVSADQVRSEAERFKNYWLAKAGREAIKLDWSRTWQNWCANDLKGWRRRVIPTGHGGELFSTPYVATPEPTPPARPMNRVAEQIAKARALMSPEYRADIEKRERERNMQ